MVNRSVVNGLLCFSMNKVLKKEANDARGASQNATILACVVVQDRTIQSLRDCVRYGTGPYKLVEKRKQEVEQVFHLYA